MAHEWVIFGAAYSTKHVCSKKHQAILPTGYVPNTEVSKKTLTTDLVEQDTYHNIYYVDSFLLWLSFRKVIKFSPCNQSTK